LAETARKRVGEANAANRTFVGSTWLGKKLGFGGNAKRAEAATKAIQSHAAAATATALATKGVTLLGQAADNFGYPEALTTAQKKEATEAKAAAAEATKVAEAAAEAAKTARAVATAATKTGSSAQAKATVDAAAAAEDAAEAAKAAAAAAKTIVSQLPPTPSKNNTLRRRFNRYNVMHSAQAVDKAVAAAGEQTRAEVERAGSKVLDKLKVTPSIGSYFAYPLRRMGLMQLSPADCYSLTNIEEKMKCLEEANVDSKKTLAGRWASRWAPAPQTGNAATGTSRSAKGNGAKGNDAKGNDAKGNDAKGNGANSGFNSYTTTQKVVACLFACGAIVYAFFSVKVGLPAFFVWLVVFLLLTYLSSSLKNIPLLGGALSGIFGFPTTMVISTIVYLIMVIKA